MIYYGKMSKEVTKIRGAFAYACNSRYRKIKHIWDMFFFNRQNQQYLPTN